MSLEDDVELQARVRAMLEHCELVNVQAIGFTAERFSPRDPTGAKVTSETSYMVEPDAFANRYEWTVKFHDADDDPVAELTATLLVEYATSDGFEPDDEAAEAIATSTGYFAAYPYVRELIQSNSARLQLDPQVLGMLRRGEDGPRSLTSPKQSQARTTIDADPSGETGRD